VVLSAQLCALNQWKHVIRAHFLVSGNLDRKASLLPVQERWPGLWAELHSPMFYTKILPVWSDLFMSLSCWIFICYPWLLHSCRQPCFIAVGSASSQIKVCSVNTGTAVECCAGAVSDTLRCVKYRVWLLSFDLSS